MHLCVSLHVCMFVTILSLFDYTYLLHYTLFRVLRQIFQSLKQISDVILLLFFVVAFFALIGQFE